VKPVNNLIYRKWMQITSVYKEELNINNGNVTEDALFVTPVTFLNIIYLFKNN
jgi:hypothetical protein